MLLFILNINLPQICSKFQNEVWKYWVVNVWCQDKISNCLRTTGYLPNSTLSFDFDHHEGYFMDVWAIWLVIILAQQWIANKEAIKKEA